MTAIELLEKSYLHFNLSKIHTRELFYLEQIPFPLFSLKDDLFHVVLYPHTPVTKELLKGLLEKTELALYIDKDNHIKLRPLNKITLGKYPVLFPLENLLAGVESNSI